MNGPVGASVGAGDVFIADQDATQVTEESPLAGGGYGPSNIFAGLGNVESVAVDGSGNVYIGSLALGLVKETLMTGISAGYSRSTIDSSVHRFGIAVDVSAISTSFLKPSSLFDTIQLPPHVNGECPGGTRCPHIRKCVLAFYRPANQD